MKTIVLLAALAVISGPPVPPIVEIPPHFHELGWRQWNAYVYSLDEVAPAKETLGSKLSRHPLETFDALHDLDQEACEAGPADPSEYPNVLRCQNLI